MRGPLAITRSLAAVGIAALVLIAATACSSSPTPPATNPGSTVAAITFAADSLVGDSLPITPGDSAQLTATPLDAQGQPVSGVTLVWSSSDTTVATVSTTGLVRSVDLGEADITVSPSTSSSAVATRTAAYSADAPYGTRSDGLVSTRGARSKIQVWSIPQIRVTPKNPTINVGDMIMFSSIAVDFRGNTHSSWIPGGPPKWGSSAPSVGTVDGTGLATGVSPGTTKITATMIINSPHAVTNSSYVGRTTLTVNSCGGVTAVPSWNVTNVVSTYNPPTVSLGPVSYMINQTSQANSGTLQLVFTGHDSTEWQGYVSGSYQVNNTATVTGGGQTTEKGQGNLTPKSEIILKVYPSVSGACTYWMEYTDIGSVTTTPSAAPPHTADELLGDLNLIGNVSAPPATGQPWVFIGANPNVPAVPIVPLNVKATYYLAFTTLSGAAAGISNTTAQAQFRFDANAH